MAEHGFYHPDRGYWQTTGTPSKRILEAYPAGTVSVPLKPGDGYEWVEGAWVYTGPTDAEKAAEAIAIEATKAKVKDAVSQKLGITVEELKAVLGLL